MTTTNSMIRSVVERIERLQTERDELASDISDVFKEARGNGLNTKALKAIIAKRRKDPHELSELETMIELYEAELGAA